MENNRGDIFQDIAENICKKYITDSRIIGLGSGSTVSGVLTQMARLKSLTKTKFPKLILLSMGRIRLIPIST
jgi:ribose 5-phosphate isomerase